MSTNLPQADLGAFRRFLDVRCDHAEDELTPEQCVSEFRAYQEEVRQFLKQTQSSVEQAERGEARPLDVEALIERVRKRWAKQGITE